MQTFVALLRSINVGKAKRVPMADLRALLIDQCYRDVATLLNSGNAVFRATRGSPSTHAAAISAVISATLSIEVPVIVKSAQELNVIVQENPIDTLTADHSQLLVAAKALLGKVGKAITTRNWATVLKLQALAHARA